MSSQPTFSMNRLGDRLNKLRVPTLLILDEMGYTTLDQVATSFLVQPGRSAT